MQIQCIIDYYQHTPNNEEMIYWIKTFAEKYRNICNAWYCDLNIIEKKLYI